MRCLVAALLILTLPAGCGGGGEAASDFPGEVRVAVGNAGGTLSGPDGVVLTVPPGAVDQPVTIGIARRASGAPAVPGYLGPAGTVYEITPHGQTFARPITIRFPAPSNDGASPPRVLVAESGGDWRGTAARRIDGALEIQRTMLSFFVVPMIAACSSADTDQDPYACYPFGLFEPTVTALPGSALSGQTVSENVALSFPGRYLARPDCGGGRLQAWRQHVRPDGTRDTKRPIFDLPVGNVGVSGFADIVFGPPGSPLFQLTAADNGLVVFTFSFSCQVASWPKRAYSDGELPFRVEIVSPPPTAPVIGAAEPADLSVIEGDAAVFSVNASGTGPLSYQWKRNGVEIAGATASRYTLAGTAQAADDGSTFSVEVRSPWGAATSRGARLTVAPAVPPALAAGEPGDQTVVEGSPATFDVDPTGTPPFSFQWRRNGTALAGATASRFTLASASRTLDDGALFSVDVHNAWGAVTSRVARLTVRAANPGGGFEVTTVASRDQGGLLLPGWNPSCGVAIDAAGNAFTCDGNRIRRFTPAGTTSIVAGSGAAGATDGPAASATFQFTGNTGLAFDPAGNLYVADTFAIRKLDTAGNVSTVAGSASPGYVDGPAGTARFMGPRGLAVDAAGNVYVADQARGAAELDYAVRRIGADGTVSTLAGGNGIGHVDGAGNTARFDFPHGVCLGPGGALYVAEVGNRDVRRVAADATVSTLAGDPGYRGSDPVDGTGGAARFPAPVWTACDTAGKVYVSDGGPTPSLRQVTLAGVVTTVVGGNAAGPADGPGLAVRLSDLTGLAIAPDGSLYAVDGARLIRIVP